MSQSAMEQQPATSVPRRRWWRSRKLIYLAVLIALAVGAYWLHEWLFMPEGLRRMQGSWKLVRFENDVFDGLINEVGMAVGRYHTINGRRLDIPYQVAEPLIIDVRGDRLLLYDPVDTEQEIFGWKIRVPTWLIRPKDCVYGTFECDDHRLVFWLKGRTINGKQLDPALDHHEKWYYERHFGPPPQEKVITKKDKTT